ncbi:GNAT family N-acetyltransferase [Streptomyces sp. NPDC051561]|uniref:GNAT family N-acetyltransferase n=1 Tax=Streptomyces sp. NPDC051561 TaxID=3365658 RepID=UPI0037A85F54
MSDSTASGVRIRPGRPGDVPAVLDMLDGAVEWMNARGNTEQWGTTPYSRKAGGAERVRHYMEECEPHIAEVDGLPVGAMVLSGGPSPTMTGIPAVDEPERYVRLLITDRKQAGLGIGAVLLAHAVEETRRAGVDLLRVDCWAGGGGELVRYYERCGFTATGPFQKGSWPGMVLARRVGDVGRRVG